MIRILFTIPNFDTAGSGKALLNVARRLDSERFEVHIACMHNRGEFFSKVLESGIPIHILNYTTNMKPYLKGIRKCYDISKKLKAIAPDIIHSFHYAADYSEPLSAKFAGIKWIYTKKNMNWGGSSKNAWYLRTYLATGIAVQNTDMIKNFFPNTANTFLIPRGVDIEKYRPKRPNIKLLNNWNLNTEQRIIMCVANLVPVKGIEILIKAFEKTYIQYNQWVLLIVGDNRNAYSIKMMNLVSELKMTEKVLFCGKQSNVDEYLNLAEVVVLPTLDKGRKEGCPVSLLEAMACGKNVLGSNISGINDQLELFPNHLIEPGSIKAWQAALVSCFSNTSNMNNQLGLTFRKHVIKNFHIDLEVSKCENLYNKLTN